MRRPVRNQMQFVAQQLDAVLPVKHQARAIWELVERLDMSRFYGSIQAVEGGPGRPASDPRVLLALWVYATVDGVGSARKVSRLCQEHDAYRWLCRGVPVDYHMLSDFRGGQEGLSDLLSQTVALLMAQGLATLRKVAQDGMRVRAGAGGGPFHRKEELEECLEKAQGQVKRLAEEREHPDPGESLWERAARERVVRERLARVEQALAQLP